MTIYNAQCIFPFFTNLPTDVWVNRFHFLGVGLTDDEVADELQDRLKAFYDTIYGAGATGRANYIDWPLAELKVFNLEDATPRIPTVRNLGITPAGTAVSTTPTEVACVLSWHAAPESGVRYQRLYNRIYLGGMTNSYMLSSTVDSFPRFSDAFTTAVTQGAQNLKNANTVDLQWRQVSSAGGVLVDRNITGGWVDNGPDTQRRRSVLASLRNNWAPL